MSLQQKNKLYKTSWLVNVPFDKGDERSGGVQKQKIPDERSGGVRFQK